MKAIPGYENLYSITKDGEVFSHKNNIYLKHQTNAWNYKFVNLYKNKKVKALTVHRLIMLTFVEKSTGGVYTTDDMFERPKSLLKQFRYLIAGFNGASLHTKDPTAMSPGIGASTVVIENSKDMKNFEYVGKI
jgi:hypothetical protein